MRRSRCDAAFRILAIVLLTLTSAFAADRKSEQMAWSDIYSAIAGAKLEMVLPSGTEIQGKLLEVGPQALTMNVTKASDSKELAKGRATVPRASVSTIHARKCGARWRVILGIGLPAGLLAAAGAAINAQSPTVKGPEAAGVILEIGAGGAVAGYFIGRQLDCRVTEITVIPEGPNH